VGLERLDGSVIATLSPIAVARSPRSAAQHVIELLTASSLEQDDDGYHQQAVIRGAGPFSARGAGDEVWPELC